MSTLLPACPTSPCSAPHPDPEGSSATEETTEVDTVDVFEDSHPFVDKVFHLIETFLLIRSFLSSTEMKNMRLVCANWNAMLVSEYFYANFNCDRDSIQRSYYKKKSTRRGSSWCSFSFITEETCLARSLCKQEVYISDFDFFSRIGLQNLKKISFQNKYPKKWIKFAKSNLVLSRYSFLKWIATSPKAEAIRESMREEAKSQMLELIVGNCNPIVGEDYDSYGKNEALGPQEAFYFNDGYDGIFYWELRSHYTIEWKKIVTASPITIDFFGSSVSFVFDIKFQGLPLYVEKVETRPEETHGIDPKILEIHDPYDDFGPDATPSDTPSAYYCPDSLKAVLGSLQIVYESIKPVQIVPESIRPV